MSMHTRAKSANSGRLPCGWKLLEAVCKAFGLKPTQTALKLMSPSLDKPEPDWGCCCSQRAKRKGITRECTNGAGGCLIWRNHFRDTFVEGCRSGAMLLRGHMVACGLSYLLLVSDVIFTKCSQSLLLGTQRQHYAHCTYAGVYLVL